MAEEGKSPPASGSSSSDKPSSSGQQPRRRRPRRRRGRGGQGERGAQGGERTGQGGERAGQGGERTSQGGERTGQGQGRKRKPRRRGGRGRKPGAERRDGEQRSGDGERPDIGERRGGGERKGGDGRRTGDDRSRGGRRRKRRPRKRGRSRGPGQPDEAGQRSERPRGEAAARDQPRQARQDRSPPAAPRRRQRRGSPAGFPDQDDWGTSEELERDITPAPDLDEPDDDDDDLDPPDQIPAPKPPPIRKDLTVDEEVLFTHPYLDDEELAGTLVNLVHVRFRDRSKVGLFDAGELVVAAGQQVVVETEQGQVVGTAAGASARQMYTRQLPRVARAVDPHDENQVVRNACREQDAFDYCRQRIEHRHLPMKLIRVEYLHGGNKAVFFFASEARVDFRDLVKDLAQRFRTRIVMRQVGVRDEAKMTGGIGSCGCELCCSSCLSKFEPVSIRMAKDQNIVLNPQKVSGQCGRLKCCLVYELEQYVECRRSLPKGGRFVSTPDGEGRVQEVDILRKLVRVLHQDGTIKTYPADQIQPAKPRRP